ncbi:DUF551 domain-containing protein [Acinetobacter indicus]|uniref:DUF551 domain-containing protein n=1 Tax=Acinetobacter indicus TaxID=756892 RepID=UPI003214241D
MDIQRKAFESSNNVNPDWSFKFDEELQQYVATDFEMTSQVDEFNEHWDTFRAGWEAKAKAVPEWISVGDSLPPVDETVLVCWDYAADIEPEKEYLTLDEDCNEYWPNCQDEPPTHWLPLPKVIKAQEPTND